MAASHSTFRPTTSRQAVSWVFDGAGFDRFFVLYAVFGWDDGTFAGYDGSPDFTISESDNLPIRITVDVEDTVICP